MLTLHDYDLVFMLGDKGGGGGIWGREEGCQASVTTDFVRKPWGLFQLLVMTKPGVFKAKHGVV